MPDFPSGDTPVGSSASPESPNVADFNTDQQLSQDQTSTETEAQVADNPAWAPILEKLPDEFHGMIRPELQKWDQTYRSVETERNDLQKRYEAFKEVPVENLAAAYQVFEMLDTFEGQKQLYEALSKVPGITPEEAQQIVEQQVAEAEGDPGDNPWEQQYNGLKTQFDQLQQMFQSMQHQEEVTKQGEIIDNRVQQLMAEDPNLDPTALLQWADMLYTRGARGDLVGQAYAEMRKYNQSVVDKYTQQAQTKQGPITMPPTGGNPGSGVDPAKRDEDARREAAAARFQSLLGQ